MQHRPDHQRVLTVSAPGGLALALLGFVGIGLLVAALGPACAARMGGSAQAWALALALPLQAACLAACARAMEGRPTRGGLAPVASALALAGLMGSDALTRGLAQLGLASAQLDGLAGALAEPVGPWVAFAAVVLAAPAEELFFRGAVFGALDARMGARHAWMGSALLFGAWHADPLHAISAFYGGLWLGWLRRRSGGLLAPVLVHALNNLLWAVGTHTGTGAPPWPALVALGAAVALELRDRTG